MKLSLIALIACAASTIASAANWPGWRGPNGDGTTSAKNLPETWSLTENVKWKTEMPAWSGSSPVVWGDRIFLNTPSKEEAAPPPPSSPKGKQRGPGGGRAPSCGARCSITATRSG